MTEDTGSVIAAPGRPGSAQPPTDGWRLPSRNVLADEVYNVIKQGLLDRRFAPGERMNLDQIARDLHVSNTPVRQALARLESEGLVTKEPFRGFSASALLDSRTIAELYEYRLFIEPPTAGNAALRRKPGDIDALTALSDPALARGELTGAAAHEAMSRRDAEFHTAIATVAGNRIVTEHLERTFTRMRLYQVYDRDGALTRTREEHGRIVEAIGAGDVDAARATMREHLLTGMHRLHTAFEPES